MPSPGQRLLIVEASASTAHWLRHSLRDDGYEILLADGPDQARMHLSHLPCGVVLIGPSHNPSTCQELLFIAKKRQPDCVCVVLLDEATMASAVDAINDAEAFRLLCRPWSHDELRMTLHQAFDFTHVSVH